MRALQFSHARVISSVHVIEKVSSLLFTIDSCLCKKRLALQWTWRSLHPSMSSFLSLSLYLSIYLISFFCLCVLLWFPLTLYQYPPSSLSLYLYVYFSVCSPKTRPFPLVLHPHTTAILWTIFRGSLDVKMAPKAVTLREETELQAMLDRLALDQEDVDGDEPEDN